MTAFFSKSRITHHLLLVVLGLIIYAQTLGFSFLSWDDDVNITGNAMVLGRDFAAIWTHAYYGMFIPLTYSLWAWLAGLGSSPEPLYFHGLNVTLHLLNTFLIYKWIDQMVVRDSEDHAPALMGALLFLTHPLQVEAVAWISGLRDILSTGLGLLSLVLWTRGKTPRNHFLACFIFILATLAKPTLVVLPLVLLIFPRPLAPDSLTKRWIRLLPWFAIGAVIVAITLQAQQNLGDRESLFWPLRPLIAIDSLGFYLEKLIFPWPLATDYGRTPSFVLSHQSYLFTLTLTLVCAFVLRRQSWARDLGVGVIFLLPALGLLPFAFQFTSTVADHYMYPALLGPACLLAVVWRDLTLFKIRPLLLILPLAWTVMATARAGIWANDGLFYSDMLLKNPASFQAHLGLGDLDKRSGNYGPALEHYQSALRLAPTSGLAQVEIAKTLILSSQNRAAIEFLTPLLQNQSQIHLTAENTPYYAQLYYYLGMGEVNSALWAKANQHLCRSFQLDPENVSLHNSLIAARENCIKRLAAESCECPSEPNP